MMEDSGASSLQSRFLPLISTRLLSSLAASFAVIASGASRLDKSFAELAATYDALPEETKEAVRAFDRAAQANP